MAELKIDVTKLVGRCCEMVLDETEYAGKTLREWINDITNGDYVPAKVSANKAENVKHGMWIEKKPSRMKWIPNECDDITEEETTIEDMVEQKCSVCQRWAIKFAHHIEMNFCPNCGADMRGDNND